MIAISIDKTTFYARAVVARLSLHDLSQFGAREALQNVRVQ